MTPEINSDTQVCISLAAKPSHFGVIFHNYLYKKLGLNFIYKNFAPRDLKGAIQGVRSLGIVGCGISMPFKSQVIPLLDAIDPTAQRIGAVNTVVNRDARLTGYNTDYVAICESVQKAKVPSTVKTAIFGSGGAAKAVVQALRDLGFRNGVILARNPEQGKALANQVGYRYLCCKGECKDEGTETFEFLFNCSPIGMDSNSPEILPFPLEVLKKCQYLGDMVISATQTPLIQTGKKLGLTLIQGIEISTIQAREQFCLYTGVRPSDELVHEAFQVASKKHSD